ncbi:accessory factor UbiK family protein [Saccharospirillum sp.]|uniref:accessory factor UbiK family protein n=1 Tax=Saccharospirillum sp. TaxID=2033801 RepID=UPI0034A04357
MKLPEDLLDQISRQASELFSQGQQARGELRQNMRSLVQAQLSKLDVVSREEFEAQQAVLQRTREQLAELEKQLADLENRLKP